MLLKHILNWNWTYFAVPTHHLFLSFSLLRNIIPIVQWSSVRFWTNQIACTSCIWERCIENVHMSVCFQHWVWLIKTLQHYVGKYRTSHLLFGLQMFVSNHIHVGLKKSSSTLCFKCATFVEKLCRKITASGCICIKESFDILMFP